MSSRETGNVFHSLKLDQAVSHFFGNFSNMFVAELVVFASVHYSIWHYLEGLLFHSYSQSVSHLSRYLCAYEMGVYDQEELCT